jgi:hypothetical protein
VAFSNALEGATLTKMPFGLEYSNGNSSVLPLACLNQPKPEHEILVIIDTGASTSLTPVIGDFLGDLELLRRAKSMVRLQKRASLEKEWCSFCTGCIANHCKDFLFK